MRLQLILVLSLFTVPFCAQNPDQWSDSTTNRVSEDIDVNFLFSYYNQDGNHSPVTGGIGTESLDDYATVITVNVPLDSSRTLSVKGGFTYYTSASNDNIDFRISSASKKEVRGDLEVGLSKYYPKPRISRGWKLGASLDVDYLSTLVGYSWSKQSPRYDRQLTIDGNFYYDSWVWLVYPKELRGTERATVPSDKRLTYNLSLTYAWTINNRLQAALIGDPTYQHGLLSIPFHRVYFADSLGARIEKLPLDRFKLPVAIRLHYFAGDLLTFRFYYRYYVDNFGIQGNTFNLEVPIKLGLGFTFYPFYRFHTQSAADYFQPFQRHLSASQYFTSDYDLSKFYSHRYGMGFRITPVAGLGQLKWSRKKYMEFKGFELRISNYQREDGLEAFAISGNFSLVIK